MTADERILCWALVIQPNGLRGISKEEFSRQFPSAVENDRVARRLFDDACKARNSDDLRCVMTVGFVFGFGPEHLDILCRLIDADWHFCHEDVVSALDDMRTLDAADALFRATQWTPAYFDYDDTRCLAVRAIWGLGNVRSSKTDAMLEALTHSDDPILRRNAAEQLERRREAT